MYVSCCHVWRIFLGNTLNDKPQTTLIRDQRVLIFHAHNLNSSLVGFIEKLKSSTIKPSQRVGLLQFLLYTCVLVYMVSSFSSLAAFWGSSIGLDVKQTGGYYASYFLRRPSIIFSDTPCLFSGVREPEITSPLLGIPSINGFSSQLHINKHTITQPKLFLQIRIFDKTR